MKSKKTKKFLIVLLIILVFIGGFFIGNVMSKIKLNDDETTQTTQIKEVEVGTQTIETTLTSSGEILSGGTEKLELSTSKYFKTMCVEEDDIVLAGENILEYSNGTYLTAEYDCLIDSYSVPETGSKCTSSNYIQVQNLETMTMQVQINESEINKVAKGQEAEIQLSAIDDKTYTGTITTINNAGTYSTSGTTFSAVIEFENDGEVKIGMSASCSIVLEKAEDCIAIPINAVQTNNEQKYVVLVKEDGTTENVNIETGISNDSYVQVTEGLSGGEKIQMVEIVTNTSNKRSSGQTKGSQSGGMEQMMGGQMPSGDMQMPSGGEMPSGMQMPSGGMQN